MLILKYVASSALVLLLTACGGGGGSSGGITGVAAATTSSGSQTVSITGDTQSTSAGTMVIQVFNGAGVEATSLSAVEIAQAKATLKDVKGEPVKGAVVTFEETGATLLNVSPASKTALTDDSGRAVVEIRALNTGSIGATSIGASANISGAKITTQKNIAISSAPSTAGVTQNPQDIAQAINFLSVNPSDRSIVLAGAGGNGRAESATLLFRVVDKNNTPVKGVLVDFVVNPSADVSLNIASASTDADGVVITTVSSKSVATAVIVKATVATKTIFTQSDQLLVTTGVGTQAGFEIGAAKYSLDSSLTGDLTVITARVVDGNGNPVADGVPIVFTTDGGRVASSLRGGCTTVNGSCNVDFVVQNPRNDGIATVTGSTRVGAGVQLSAAIKINMSDPALSFVATGTTTTISELSLSTCKGFVSGDIINSKGRSAAAGTSIAAKGVPQNFNATISDGSPVLDRSSPFSPTGMTLEVDAGSISGNYACIVKGFQQLTATAVIEMTTPAGKVKTAQSLKVTYPGGNFVLSDESTGAAFSEIDVSGSCATSTFTFELSTNVPAYNASAGVLPIHIPLGTVVQTSLPSSFVATGAASVVNTGSPIVSPNVKSLVNIGIKPPSSGASACQAAGTESGIIPMTLVMNTSSGTRLGTAVINVKYSKF